MSSTRKSMKYWTKGRIESIEGYTKYVKIEKKTKNIVAPAMEKLHTINNNDNTMRNLIDEELIYESKKLYEKAIKEHKESYNSELTKDDIDRIESECSIIAKKIFEFEFLIFGLIKSSPNNYIPLEGIHCLLSGNDVIIPSQYDRQLLRMMMVLYKRQNSVVHLQEELDEYEENTSSGERLLSWEENRIQINPNGKLDKLSKEGVFTKISLNELGYHQKHKIDIFNKLLAYPGLIDYETKFIPFPSIEDGEAVSQISLNFKECKTKYTFNRIWGKGILADTHSFKFTEFISKISSSKKPIKIKFNILKEAILIDEAISKAYPDSVKDIWQKRVKGISIDTVRFTGGIPQNIQTADIELQDISHIIGMLGAGKSTFTQVLNHFAFRNDLKIVHVVKDKAAIIESFKEYSLIADICGKKIGIFRGNSDIESLEQKELYKNNTCSSGVSENDFFKYPDLYMAFDNTEILRNLHDSLPKHEKNTDLKSFSNVIGVRNKKKSTFANPEYKRWKNYYWVETLMDSNMWIGNMHSLMMTKIPYQYDFKCMDMYTAVHLFADIIIFDECDEAMYKTDDMFMGILPIMSSDPENVDAFNHELEKEISKENRLNFTSRFAREMHNRVNEQRNKGTALFTLLGKDNIKYIENRLNREFSLSGKIAEYIYRYFCTKRIENGKEYIERIDSNHPRFEEISQRFKECISKDASLNYTTKTAKTIFPLIDFVLMNDSYLKNQDVDSKSFAMKQVKKINDTIKQLGININFKDKTWVEKYYARATWQFIREFASEYNLEVMNTKDSSIYTKVGEEVTGGEKIFNFWVALDLCFLLVLQDLDSYQRIISRNSDQFFRELRVSNQGANFIPRAQSCFPSPLLDISNRYKVVVKKIKNPQEKTHNAYVLETKKYPTIGRVVLTESREIIGSLYPKIPLPKIVFLSATSYLHESSKYHIPVKPTHLLQRNDDVPIDIQMHLNFAKNSDGDFIKVSGSSDREVNCLEIFEKLKEQKHIVIDKQTNTEKTLNHIEYLLHNLQNIKDNHPEYECRQLIGIPVSSYSMVQHLTTGLRKLFPNVKTKGLFNEGHYYNGKPIMYDPKIHVDRSNVTKLYNENLDIFVFVMSAVGRGYNILQSEESRYSLIGAIMFPTRPYLTPDDSKWYINLLHASYKDSVVKIKASANDDYLNFDNLEHFYIVYNRLLRLNRGLLKSYSELRLKWISLPKNVKYAMVANFLIEMLQTMGRGIRGGTALHVELLDAAFVSDKTLVEMCKGDIAVENEENEVYRRVEKEDDSFVSIAESILTVNHVDDILFGTVNYPLIDAFRGLVLK